MSSFIINNKTASTIVSGLIELSYIHDTEAQHFLNMMMDLNVKSVNERYSENDESVNFEFKKQETGFFDEDEFKANFAMLQMIVNISFYYYQSSDTDICDETLVMRTLNKMKGDLLSYYKGWLIENNYNDNNDWKGKDFDDLPFSEKATWGLYD